MLDDGCGYWMMDMDGYWILVDGWLVEDGYGWILDIDGWILMDDGWMMDEIGRSWMMD